MPELQEDNKAKEADTPKKSKEKKPADEDEPNYTVGGLWTDDDFVDLLRLTKKFPAGTPER